ncbi:uncharacterized protein THITE_2088547 [Thermothielavioides terrestris NRRL 8126]|uniref:Diaminohydroxyphosphoribosylamino-pyrimidine deaminase n=1 Tax=Thermothielavioides terrestris (strain ATCC 38088 / NRRL 8126) TaxID=578455 RepID=G2QYH0_THETT|nr:uncharacterized protein THITE_2088547 [Thermothielavioides terrestris NRRL 8126]AEO67065.1 hypothetical protein THITE_2088547 [Thermothielavioides terrestris NRRL 8126]
MGLASLLQALGPPVQSVEEETFALFAQDLPHEQNLGFVDAKALSLELTVAGRDLTIHQSPAVLSSNRAGGTTGAVLWKITPLFAAWLASPTSNPLFTHGILSATSLVLELGCGVSGLAALLLAPHIARYVLTDQVYVARLVERNVAENWAAVVTAAANSTGSSSGSGGGGGGGRGGGKAKQGKPAKAARRAVASASSTEDAGGGAGQKIVFTPLDWETDAVTAALAGGGSGGAKSFDVVVACDCVYNEALIEPFVATCADVCRLRIADDDEEEGGGDREDGVAVEGRGERNGRGLGIGRRKGKRNPCVCVVAQQLRDPLVFEAWLERFARSFHVWRVPDGLLVEGLRSGSGFVVHMGVLKNEGDGGINLEAI